MFKGDNLRMSLNGGFLVTGKIFEESKIKKCSCPKGSSRLWR